MVNNEPLKLQSLDYHLFLLIILGVAWCLAHLPLQTVGTH